MRVKEKPSIAAVLLVGVCLFVEPSVASSITFDFGADGIGPDFSMFQQRPFWTITTDLTGLRISKPADNGSSFTVPDTRSDAGLIANFTMNGDFNAIIDFSWNQTATPTFSAGDNSASFILTSVADPSYSIAISSVTLWNGTQRVDVNYSGPVSPLLPPAATDPNTPLLSTLQFTRVGSTLSLTWGSTPLDTVLLPAELQGEVFLTIDAHQGQGSLHPTFTGVDPRDPMDVSFSTLSIDADDIKGLVPEPSPLVLAALFGPCITRRRREGEWARR